MVPEVWSSSGTGLQGCHECTLSTVGTQADMILDVSRTKNTITQTSFYNTTDSHNLIVEFVASLTYESYE